MKYGSFRPFTISAMLAVAALPSWAQFKPAESDSTAQQPPLLQPQDRTAEGQPKFSVKVNLVRVLVSVRDPHGAPRIDLNQGDFHILDTGVPQDIALFERHTSLPLSVAILVDTSGSTERELHYEEDSVLRFIPTLLSAGNPADAFALFSFNWRTSMEVDYTRNQRRAERALRGLHGEGGTSLYDAVYLVSDTLSEREGRHVLIVVTDGGDTTSYKHYQDALAAAQRADAVIYPIVVIPIPGEVGRNIGGEHALTTLAESTGGRIFYPEGFERIDQAFTTIIEELRTQYLLGFYPRGVVEEPRRYHPLQVEVSPPGMHVTARSGYYEP
ncbi:MAG: VWA domain-containing protein [Acidobacteriaceae bacterium]|nr:VWA domain-containing protein [Acidobacteriaceae bacterium]